MYTEENAETRKKILETESTHIVYIEKTNVCMFVQNYLLCGIHLANSKRISMVRTEVKTKKQKGNHELMC